MKQHKPLKRYARRPPEPTIGVHRDGQSLVKIQAPGVTVTMQTSQVDPLGYPMTTVEVTAVGASLPMQGKPWWIEGERDNRKITVRIIQREKV